MSVPLGHDFAELLVVEPAVAVQIGLLHEGVEFVLGQCLAFSGRVMKTIEQERVLIKMKKKRVNLTCLPHRRRQENDLAGLDVARLVLVEDAERLAKALRVHQR